MTGESGSNTSGPSPSADLGDVCIVTQPERSQTGKSHVHDLADVIGNLTAVSILTANLPANTGLRDDHEVIEFSSAGTGENLLTEVLRFVLNQIRLCLALRRREEEIVLFFGATSYLLPVAFTRLLGKTVIILPRGDVPLSLQLRWEETLPDAVAKALAGLVTLLERANYRLADGIVTYTPAMARELDLGRYEQKLHTNGARFVDTEQFDVSVPFEQRDRNVGFIGRLDVEKRVPELAAAAQQLPEDTRFVFVGDGEYGEMLEQQLADETANERAELVGWVDRTEVPAQLNRLQLLVVPSHPTEGLPTVILEAMACGTPVYATPVSGVPDVVREGQTGYHMNDVSPDQIADEITAALDSDDLPEISQSCRQLIEDEYSFEAALDRYEQILSSMSER